MDLRVVERAAEAYQQPVTADQIDAMCRRAFGSRTRARSAVELDGGTYNSTFRVDLGAGDPVVLRVAPAPERQFRSEREWMRNEHASVPYFAPIAGLLPRTLAVDFTHQVIGRDYVFQTLLDGVPAPQGLRAYPRPRWAPFHRALAAVARQVHAVRGDRFGPVAGPWFTTWSEAVVAGLRDCAADLDGAGLDAADVRRVATAAERERTLLDGVAEPRLLHGDLWTGNLLLARDAPVPTITGVLDCDRTLWGDPEADWTLFVAERVRDAGAFHAAYGPRPDTPEARRRRLFYRARHIAAIRLERHRLGRKDTLQATFRELDGVLAALADRAAR